MVNAAPVIFWFRRDLRLTDNRGLFEALNSGHKVQLLFIFDTDITDELSADDHRISLIYDQLKMLHEAVKPYNSSLLVKYGRPAEVFREVFERLKPAAVYTNEDYEPYAVERDEHIAQLCDEYSIGFEKFKDQVIVHPREVLKKDGKPYTVFTPWSKKWFAAFDAERLSIYHSEQHLQQLAQSNYELPKLDAMGFQYNPRKIQTEFPAPNLLKNYVDQRDFPAVPGTSRLSVVLRFGFISIRKLVKHAAAYDTFLNELAWREFYMMIIFHFPHVVSKSFKPQYENIRWRNNADEFARWCQGNTGYPIVDAGMRELNQTGYMHNRVRMITASFLTKHLLTDWRWGEAYFAQKLTDYELASNNGGWQWAAGSGCDAAPYFRVFNPELQTKKFDPHFSYIKKWVPEYQTSEYFEPVVEHKYARERALSAYKQGLNQHR